MGKDWIEWHRAYQDPESPLSRRLAVVQGYLRQALAIASARGEGELRLISLCAGDGRDVLPVLAEHDAGHRFRALLVELNAELADRARATATDLGLGSVEVHTADAGLTGVYATAIPAQVVMACGVFGNIPPEQVKQTIGMLPGMLAAGGIVIWTRGRGDSGGDPSLTVRRWFAESGYAELAFSAPPDVGYRVGMHQLSRAPAPPLRPGSRMFAFL